MKVLPLWVVAVSVSFAGYAQHIASDSLKLKKQPLYILNDQEVEERDIQRKIFELDPNDIKEIEVLKDEPATLAYGDKGKNGVVRIITKNVTQPKNRKE